MKVLLINGSPHQHGCTFTALSEVEGALHKHGIETEIFWIGRESIPGCIACMKCEEGNGCVLGGGVNDIAARLDTIDALVVGTPVYYAAPSGQLCAFLDRLFFSNSGRFAGKLGAAIASSRRAGSVTSFDRLNKYFTISNMPVVSSQYWNEVHGHTPEEVRRDLEGMQTMRTLGENMAWLLKCIEAGRKAGVPAPQYEPWTATNFIS